MWEKEAYTPEDTSISDDPYIQISNHDNPFNKMGDIGPFPALT
jgi:hypothetical protein